MVRACDMTALAVESDLTVCPIGHFFVFSVMEINFPNLQAPFIKSVGCCWRVAVAEFTNYDELKGAIVAENETGIFIRCLVERDRPGNRYGKTIHVHVEVANLQFFDKGPPTPSADILEIAKRVSSAIEDRELLCPTHTIKFNIPMCQIAVGSALGSLVGFQVELANHGALLTEGKMEASRDSESNLDSLSFRIKGSDDDMSFDITVQGPGDSAYSPDCLTSAAVRGSELFQRLVLAKKEGQP